MYYKDKIKSLERLFGSNDIVLELQTLVVDRARYPIIDDVVILSDPDQYTDFVRRRIQSEIPKIEDDAGGSADRLGRSPEFVEKIQFTFGEEWSTYDDILVEHEKEFLQYFDLINLTALHDLCVCDLGCGNGRWSYYLKGTCKEIVLVDFSDAIFVARKNLSNAKHCLFFMCDLKRLPFKENFVDFLFCLGVLHHLPTPCLDEVRNLKRFAPTLLIYLYYSLDNRPVYFHFILKMVTFLRLCVHRVRSPVFRRLFSRALTCALYMPLILLGHVLKPRGLGSYVPLFEVYRNKSIRRIEQDVYDRFFTGIEQRVSRQNILMLHDTFKQVKVSDNLPYYHFLCRQ